MASQKTKFAVGLFLVGGTAVALVAVIWLGVTRYFEKGHLYVTYFNESVQGLEKDAPVKYRGVTIGRVESISVAPDSKLIKVVLKVESGMSLDANIVAQLKNVGITGSMFIELDQHKEGEPDQSPALSFPSEYPIVASKPAEISELLRGLDEVLSKMKALDLEGVVEKLKSDLDLMDQTIRQAKVEDLSRKVTTTLDGINHVIDKKRWDDILMSLQQTVQTANSTFAHADKTFAQMEAIMADENSAIRGALENFREAMLRANVFLEKASSLAGGTQDALSEMRGDLLSTARNLEQASENLNRVMEIIAEQPSQMLFGQPPPPREGVSK
jgi:phospholipid/cholesterol/gamma-HCH transport system substrate-binding protein